MVLEVSFKSIALGLRQSRTSWWRVCGDRAASLVVAGRRERKGKREGMDGWREGERERL